LFLIIIDLYFILSYPKTPVKWITQMRESTDRSKRYGRMCIIEKKREREKRELSSFFHLISKFQIRFELMVLYLIFIMD